MSKIIYRTGAQMRAENKIAHPEWFNKTAPAYTQYFFRGESCAKLLSPTDYSFFLRTMRRVGDVETAYRFTQRHIAKREEQYHDL